MKKRLLFIFTLFAINLINSQVLEETLFVDFGPNDSTNGNVTSNPDSNGNYWNNPIDPKAATASPLTLIENDNTNTNYTLNVNTDMFTNGIQSGGLINPEVSLLGEFAINTATQDYFTSNGDLGELTISNLNSNYGYKFSMFASRTGSATRSTKYTLTGSNTTSGTLVTTGTGIGNNSYDGNNNTIYTSDYVFPDSSGNIKINISKAAGAFCYINAMKIESYSGLSIVNVATITLSGNNITSNRETSKITATILPETADEKGVTWSVSDDSIAYITQEGIVYPKSNGNVEITATSKEENSTVSGTINLAISNQHEPSNDFLIDFGENNTTSGNQTTSPDTNNNYWNNLIDPETTASAISLIDKTGNSSSYNISISGESFSSNGGSASGGLMAPEESLLGEYAISSATEDYFFNYNKTSKLIISNLDLNNAYSFNLFGSRNTTSTRISQYSIIGLDKSGATKTTVGTNQTSGSGIGSGTSSVNGNDSYVFTSEMVYPNSNGEITIEITATTGGFAYINFMKIDEFTPSSLSINKFKNVSLSFYPNPVKNYLNLDTKSNLSVKKVEVFNIIGSKVLSISNKNSINLKELKPGIYVVKTLISNEYSKSFKIIKE
ncbi:T9SS type A sorting domain-containing protein [Polaribacter tangerinus]|uniref:T9SS type A sorting domain-containing protein n=1 Tax=Polaribacter tangerinus TaxID=1920034 RepID=UPI000B4A65CD|nr:T9SS type A sorting domain-containing protein [Polaribacter tangerinus]